MVSPAGLSPATWSLGHAPQRFSHGSATLSFAKNSVNHDVLFALLIFGGFRTIRRKNAFRIRKQYQPFGLFRSYLDGKTTTIKFRQVQIAVSFYSSML